jgi:tetratricopeptide (TPR) repeat protein
LNGGINSALAPLIEASRRAELVVFAGAGISMSAPSYLPSWKGFNAALIEEIKTSALAFPGLPDAAAAAIRRLDIEQIGVEALSDEVVRSFASESYFPLLEVLDADETNAHHQAVAELARRGSCRSVVTTNFDTLLERAFRAAGVECEAFETPEDFRRSPKAACPIYKIHGSVTAAAGLVDTVSQKLRGLSFAVRARLIDLYHCSHVLVIGFSGADLAFGADYLALSALKDGDKGITWIVEPGRTLSLQVEAIVRAANGQTVQASLNEVFAALGVSDRTASPPDSHVADMHKAEADARARARIRRWLEELGSGPLESANFCIELADQAGWRTEANALRAALAADLEGRETLPVNAIVVFNGLAAAADQVGDYAAQERWAGRALSMWAEFERRRRISVEPVGTAGMRGMTRQEITAWIQIGRARAGRGETRGAREAFARARQAAEEIHDTEVLARLLASEAQLLSRDASSVEGQIELLRRASILGAASGSAQVMTEAALMEGYALATIGEYDSALAALERAQRTVRWSGSLLSRLSPDLLRAELAARRGRADEAAQLFESAIARAADDPVLAARIRMVAVSVLSNHPSTSASALAHVDQVLAEMDQGRIPRLGPSLLPSEDEAKKIRKAVLELVACAKPYLPTLPPGVPERERELREILLHAEFERNPATIASALHDLTNRRYDAARPRRMLDLAEAAVSAAELSGNRELLHSTLCLVGMARDLSGDLQGAIAVSRAILEADPPVEEARRMTASQTLAVVLAKIGRVSEAVTLLLEVVAYREREGDVAEHTRSIIALADTLARGGDRAGARVALEQGAAVIERSGERLAIAKRDDMLASLSQQERGWQMPPPLLFADSNVHVALEQIEPLLRKSESPQERCDIAALTLASGHTCVATDIVLQAQADFQTDSDARGVARCFHLLADAAQVGGRWDSAADLTTYALKLEQDLEDVPGQIASYGALALQSIAVERFDRAEWAATECLKRADPNNCMRFTIIARCALAEARLRVDPGRDARRVVERMRQQLAAAHDVPSELRAWLGERLARLSSRWVLRRLWRTGLHGCGRVRANAWFALGVPWSVVAATLGRSMRTKVKHP